MWQPHQDLPSRLHDCSSLPPRRGWSRGANTYRSHSGWASPWKVDTSSDPGLFRAHGSMATDPVRLTPGRTARDRPTSTRWSSNPRPKAALVDPREVSGCRARRDIDPRRSAPASASSPRPAVPIGLFAQMIGVQMPSHDAGPFNLSNRRGCWRRYGGPSRHRRQWGSQRRGVAAAGLSHGEKDYPDRQYEHKETPCNRAFPVIPKGRGWWHRQQRAPRGVASLP